MATLIEFNRPEWFLLIPALIFIGWLLRGLRLWRPLRVLCLALLTLVLADPQINRTRPGTELWLLADGSDSARPALTAHLDEWLHLLRSGKGAQDTLRIVDFAAEARERIANATNDELKATDGTHIALAAQVALAGRDKQRTAKILLLGDGYSTEPLDGLGEQLREAGLPLFYRLALLDPSADTRLNRLRVAQRVTPGEPVLIEFDASGPAGRTARYQLRRNGEIMASREFVFDPSGRAAFRLVDSLHQSGSHHYSVAIIDEADALNGNNRMEAWVMVEGGPRIVLLSAYADDPVAQALQRAGLAVQLVTDFSTLSAGTIAGARAVVLNNVPASALGNEFLQALRFHVAEQGGGLAMIGGRHSFGSGGYFDSPIDDILPVSMEIREDHKKLAVAMAIVLDRSGSMSMHVNGGQTKMALANAGAADTVRLMGGYDMVTVFAVDSEAHRVVPLTAVSANRDEVIHRVRRIESMGGGIFVYTGLKAAWEELQKAEAGQKHTILFADASDAEEPGRYQQLLREMTEQGATLSVIGMGTPSDSDAYFLRDIAKRGNGRIFFSDNPLDIPSLFAQETVAVTRSAFINEPVGMQPTAGWLEISPQPLVWPAHFEGYNLSYLRERATLALRTTDEYEAPLLAFWRRGSGLVAAVTFPLGGEASAAARNWPGYGDFIQTLARWLMQSQPHRDLGLRTRLDGSHLIVDLFYNEAWQQQHPASSPVIVYQQPGSQQAARGVWQRISPGHYRASLPLQNGAPLLGAVQWEGVSLPFGPVALQQNAEWQMAPHMLQAFKDAAHISGGGPLNHFDAIWQSDNVRRMQSLRVWLLVFFAAAFLAEAAWLRWGWNRNQGHR